MSDLNKTRLVTASVASFILVAVQGAAIADPASDDARAERTIPRQSRQMDVQHREHVARDHRVVRESARVARRQRIYPEGREGGRYETTARFQGGYYGAPDYGWQGGPREHVVGYVYPPAGAYYAPPDYNAYYDGWNPVGAAADVAGTALNIGTLGLLGGPGPFYGPGYQYPVPPQRADNWR